MELVQQRTKAEPAGEVERWSAGDGSYVHGAGRVTADQDGAREMREHGGADRSMGPR